MFDLSVKDRAHAPAVLATLQRGAIPLVGVSCDPPAVGVTPAGDSPLADLFRGTRAGENLTTHWRFVAWPAESLRWAVLDLALDGTCLGWLIFSLPAQDAFLASLARVGQLDIIPVNVPGATIGLFRVPVLPRPLRLFLGGAHGDRT